MSANSGSFDLLANVLHEARTPAVQPKPPKRKRKRAEHEIDRSRDHAFYAAPHLPIRRYAHSRPEDIVTERVQREAAEPARAAVRPQVRSVAKPPRGLVLMLVACLATLGIGLSVILLTR